MPGSGPLDAIVVVDEDAVPAYRIVVESANLDMINVVVEWADDSSPVDLSHRPAGKVSTGPADF